MRVATKFIEERMTYTGPELRPHFILEKFKVQGSAVTAYAVHPGVVATDAWRRIPPPFRWLVKQFMITPEDGAKSTLVCATSPDLAKQSGRYYTAFGKEQEPNRVADDVDLAKTLWTKSAEWTGLSA